MQCLPQQRCQFIQHKNADLSEYLNIKSSFTRQHHLDVMFLEDL